MKRVSLLAFATLALAGCAMQDSANTNSEPYVEREYRTGSNIAAKHSPYADGVRTMSKDEIDRLGDTNLNQVAPVMAPGTR
jgi:hypothetical protein